MTPSSSSTGPSTPGRHVVLGAGPVGRGVVAELIRTHQIEPVVVTRSGTHVPGGTSVRADITDVDVLTRVLERADVVYQCAQPAYDRWPQEFPALQAVVVDAASATGALLVAVENLYGYGPVEGPINERHPLAATTRKGAVRAQMWRDLHTAHEAGRIRAVAARASDFFGLHVDGSAYGERFVSQVKAGKKVDIVGDPDTTHSVTYVPDLAAAMVRLSTEPDAWGRAWHVPNAPAVTQRRFVELAGRAAGTTPTVRTISGWQMRALSLFVAPLREVIEMAYEFDHDFVVDHSDYATSFGATATTLEEALATTFDTPAEAEAA